MRFLDINSRFTAVIKSIRTCSPYAEFYNELRMHFKLLGQKKVGPIESGWNNSVPTRSWIKTNQGLPENNKSNSSVFLYSMTHQRYYPINFLTPWKQRYKCHVLAETIACTKRPRGSYLIRIVEKCGWLSSRRMITIIFNNYYIKWHLRLNEMNRQELCTPSSDNNNGHFYCA